MTELSPAERKALRARAHPLHPVVIIGSGGLTPDVLREIETNLKSHELIKVRALGDDRDGREALMSQICEAASAAPVQTIGKVLVIYRPRPPNEEKKKKRRPTRKPERRTKRSYQRS
jgi:RNA-binding protein